MPVRHEIVNRKGKQIGWQAKQQQRSTAKQTRNPTG
jgi:hypothetical protein